jgi:hypothetical protein
VLEAQASADAELGFDAGDAIVDIDDFAGEGIELDVQAIEARFKATEPRINAVESGIRGGVMNDVR